MRNKSIVWIPVLLVGAMVYWTLALGFGGLSLVSLTSELPGPEGDARDSYQSITVNLSESPESEAAVAVERQAGDRAVDGDPLPDLDVPRVRGAAELDDQAGQVGQGGLGLTGGTVRTGPGQTAF
jgi:hypothetical protein